MSYPYHIYVIFPGDIYFFEARCMHVLVTTVTITPSSHCYISSLMLRENCLHKVSYMNFSSLFYQHVLIMLFFEKSRKPMR